MMIRSNVDAIKVVNRGHTTSSYDVFLVIISDSGSVSRAVQVSMSSSSALGKVNNIKTPANSLRRIGNYYAFAGSTIGFSTSQ